MNLLQTLQVDLKESLKAKETDKRDALRLLLSQLKNNAIDAGVAVDELDDEVVIGVIRKEMKKRAEAMHMYKESGRDELFDQEKIEHDIFATYVPAQMSEEQVAAVVATIVAEQGGTGEAQFGQVMGAVMAKLKGQADGGMVNAQVKKALNG